MNIRPIDNRRANWLAARHWLRSCVFRHRGFCKPLEWSGAASAPFTLRVFDTVSKCIVRAPKGCRYAALSYRWGNGSDLQATKEQPFTKVGSLSAERCQVPKTISDAVIACTHLNIRYLWVDRLCILQNDMEDKTSQIEHMSYIYSGAQLTIVAGYGDSDAGLPGVSDVQRTSHLFETNINGARYGAKPWNVLDPLMASPWYSRGWTFQELIFSKRLLCFTEEQMLFFCNKAVFREDMWLEAQHGMVSHVRNLTAAFDFPLQLTGLSYHSKEDIFKSVSCIMMRQALEAFETFATSYLRRNLTNEGDILNAFCGVLEALLPYLGPFRWGLPIMLSRSILTWRSGDCAPLERRAGIPSWSWAGWRDYQQPLSLGLILGDRLSITDNSKPPIMFAFTERDQLVDIPSAGPLTRTFRDWGSSNVPSLLKDVLPLLPRPLTQYVVLFARCAYLPVDRQPSSPDKDEFEIRDVHGLGLKIGSMMLKSEWRAKQPDRLEFIISNTKALMGNLMLIVRDGPVAYRIQSTETARIKFTGASARNKLIVLG